MIIITEIINKHMNPTQISLIGGSSGDYIFSRSPGQVFPKMHITFWKWSSSYDN